MGRLTIMVFVSGHFFVRDVREVMIGIHIMMEAFLSKGHQHMANKLGITKVTYYAVQVMIHH